MAASKPPGSDVDTLKIKQVRRFCEVCQSIQNLKRCGRCKSTFYCCRDHQKSDWPLHKDSCTTRRKETGESDPSTETESCNGNANSRATPTQEIVTQTQRDEEDETRAEIESILDFQFLNNVNISSESSELDSKESEGKEIFAELHNSDVNNYMGPSDAFVSGDPTYGCIDSSLQLELQVDEENLIDSIPEVSYSPNPIQQNNSQLQEVTDIENSNSVIFSEDTSNLINVESSTDSQQRVTEEENNHLVSHEIVTPLDSRPLRKLKFPKPTSYQYKELAEFISLRLINLGYCILDELFEDDHIDGIQTELNNFDAKNWFCGETPGAEGIHSSEPAESDRSKTCSDRKRWIEEDEEGMSLTSKAVRIIDSIMKIINPPLREYSHIKGRTKVMVSCDQGDGSFQRRQVDNSNKDGRRITCILYLNRDWDVTTDGGLLRILPPHLDKPIDVPPKANRLVVFWSDQRNPYEVHPIYKKRFSLTVWYFDSKEKEDAKVEELKTETEKITARIAELEESKRQIEESTRQRIEDTAMAAVRSLSEEELQALSVLVYNHPQPRQVLTAIGIEPTIQEALIRYLGNL